MNYKLIRLSSEPKVIGVSNGIYQMEIDWKAYGIENDKKAIWQFVSQDGKFKNFLDEKSLKSIDMLLLKKAKLTDFMAHSPKIRGGIFSTSEYCLSLLSKYKLDSYEVIKLNLQRNGERLKENYNLILYPFITFDSFCFDESIMCTGSDLIGKTYHRFLDFKHLQSFVQQNSAVSFEKVVIKAGKKMFDLLQISSVGLFMSERLMDACIKEGLTGLDIPMVAPILELR